MKQLRLRNTSDTYFNQAWQLYEDAFPPEERRSLDNQSRIMKNANYNFDVVLNQNQCIGFLLWWDLKNYKYIDHFATSISQRNKGFGKSILEKFIGNTDKTILLEVELPNTIINKRRIKFYERIGFKLNQQYYEIPPSIEGQPSLQLLLMSYPFYLTEKDVEQFVKTCHPILFKHE